MISLIQEAAEESVLVCVMILHNAVICIEEVVITSKRKYHTITEAKNGAGAVPIKTPKGWIHIAHGVRNTAAGLRYVVYAFATSLERAYQGSLREPRVGFLIAPLGAERVGDVSNVCIYQWCNRYRDNGRCIYLLCIQRYKTSCSNYYN